MLRGSVRAPEVRLIVIVWSFQVEEEERGGVRGRSLGDLRGAGRREPQVSRREAGEVAICYRCQWSSRRGG